ncbi:MAG TPA: hypothetical protein VHQ93_20630 [Chitinophagaceae bacterium]|nr:hypothetical protein [Chitinophagaceae bacterium]
MSLNTTAATGLVQNAPKAKSNTSLIKTHFKKILTLFTNLLLISFSNNTIMKQTTAAIKQIRKSGLKKLNLN